MMSMMKNIMKTTKNYTTCSTEYFPGCCAIETLVSFEPLEYPALDDYMKGDYYVEESIRTIVTPDWDCPDSGPSYFMASIIKKGCDPFFYNTNWKLVRKELVSLGFKSLTTFIAQGSKNTIEILGLDTSKMSKPKSKKKK